jgi:hypothetical protein
MIHPYENLDMKDLGLQVVTLRMPILAERSGSRIINSP